MHNSTQEFDNTRNQASKKCLFLFHVYLTVFIVNFYSKETHLIFRGDANILVPFRPDASSEIHIRKKKKYLCYKNFMAKVFERISIKNRNYELMKVT